MLKIMLSKSRLCSRADCFIRVYQPFLTALLEYLNLIFYGCSHVTNHNILSLQHNFTIRTSTGVYESRILLYIQYVIVISQAPVLCLIYMHKHEGHRPKGKCVYTGKARVPVI